MADAEDDLVAELAAVAERAAPATASGSHLGESELARIRLGEEEPALDESLRHLASCAACRARLVELEREPRIARAAAPKAIQPRRAARSNALLRGLVWPAAAIALCGLGYALTQRVRSPEHLQVVQRAYAGVMGSHDTGASYESTNLELSFAAEPATVVAFVVPSDESGKLLSWPQWFVPERSGRAVVVLAPRTFAAHSGKALGLVVFGSEAAVRPVADRLNELAATNPPSASEQSLTQIASEHGARLQRVSLALP